MEFYRPRGYPHELLLERFNLMSLVSRRVEHSMIFLYKVLHNLYDCPYILSKISRRVARPNSRTKSVFYIPTVRTNVGESSPLIQVVKNYSGVEELLDIFVCSIPSIRSCLKQTLANRS
jgi:hypothetical protein